jgi:small subunit ribosomal protein S4
VAKYNGPVCRICRRENQKLFLKGERCLSDKCSYERKEYAPGIHGQRRAKISEYGQQLREKQKVKRTYGLMEKPFKNLFDKAAQEKGITSERFFTRLELRLDNVAFRMGFAASRQEAKQVVRHNHMLVNGKRLNIPSAMLKVGDTVSLADKSKENVTFKKSAELYEKRPKLAWFEVDLAKGIGKVTAEPQRDDIGLAVKERLIVELYSK